MQYSRSTLRFICFVLALIIVSTELLIIASAANVHYGHSIITDDASAEAGESTTVNFLTEYDDTNARAFMIEHSIFITTGLVKADLYLFVIPERYRGIITQPPKF